MLNVTYIILISLFPFSKQHEVTSENKQCLHSPYLYYRSVMIWVCTSDHKWNQVWGAFNNSVPSVTQVWKELCCKSLDDPFQVGPIYLFHLQIYGSGVVIINCCLYLDSFMHCCCRLFSQMILCWWGICSDNRCLVRKLLTLISLLVILNIMQLIILDVFARRQKCHCCH